MAAAVNLPLHEASREFTDPGLLVKQSQCDMILRMEMTHWPSTNEPQLVE